MVNLDVTADESGTDEPKPGAGACLTLAFQAEQPLLPARRHFLPESGRVFIGRDTGTEPYITLADRFASAPHASLQRSYGRWLFQDEQSRNGCFVDGVEVSRCELHDGAIIEIGRTFFVFRAQAAFDGAAPDDDFATLNASYAARLLELTRAAPSALPVVLRGESGTGKEVMARAIHRLSGRPGRFQAINCAALAASLAESELFGYCKGAFSGAQDDRPGLIRSAHKGTLFLDEIGDLPLPAQGLFLRVLQESEVTAVGTTKAVPVDFRLIAATHRDLEEMATAGTFRPDLLARIEGFTLRLPPLRDRREDLGSLVAVLLRRHAGAKAANTRFSLAAARALMHHGWALNIRELEKALRLALTLGDATRIDLSHLPPLFSLPRAGEARVPTRVLPAGDERREELVLLLRDHKGNVSEVARVLGRARMQIHRWMKRYGLKPDDYR
ncbi:MAG TPA: sigma 54-interacting transcriptional regulator [Myxococcales bacterium]|nr:sigma 54-interacting transcriptional regulator [Myxococcales bacterium]